MIESSAYIKRAGSHELGYRKGQPGGAGPYLLVSMASLDFFPQLSELVENDQVVLNIIPSFTDEIVLTNFIYHNSKIVSNQPNGRNEHRIYLNSGIHPQGNYFHPDDILIFVKFVLDGLWYFKIVHLRKSNQRKQYELADELLEKFKRRGSDAIIPSHLLSFISQSKMSIPIDISKKVFPRETITKVLSSPIVDMSTETRTTSVTNLIRSTGFRDIVLFFYENKCAITGAVIEYGKLCNLEAAHIRARKAHGADHPANGIALSRDMHWAFDKGFFTITDEYKIKVHPKVRGIPMLSTMNNSTFFVPSDRRAKPHIDAIKWHQRSVYGKYF